MPALTVYDKIRKFGKMTKNGFLILQKNNFNVILCGFLMSKKRICTRLSTGDVDNKCWIIYGIWVYHVAGSARETDFENYRNNRTEDKMDYRELVRRECPDMEPIV